MSKLYQNVCKVFDKFVPASFQPLWNHPAGPKTIFFWAPAIKWGLVIANLGDINRPAEKLSLMQYVSLATSGLIWSRYSLIIIPKNWSLFSVNVFVFCTSGYQVLRAARYQMDKQITTEIKGKEKK